MIFDFCKSIASATELCTREAFEKIVCSEQVSQICDEIRRLNESLPADAGEEGEKRLQKRVDELKRQLPAFCFHASFSDHRRHNQSAVPSGLVSLDLDDIESPAEFFARLRDKALALGLLLAYVTPSTHGLKLVFRVPSDSRTIEEAQERLAAELGIGSYHDAVCHDMARMAFATPASYILYREDGPLFDANKAAEGFCTDRELDESILARNLASTADAAELEPLPANDIATRYVDGIALTDLLRELCVQVCGQPVPSEGMRNNCLYETTKVMRVFLNNDMEAAAHVMPTWGLDNHSWWSTIRSAHSRPIAASTREKAEALLLKLRRQKAVSEGDGNWSLPAPPKVLPPVFREFARVTPPEMQPAQLLSLLPILGFYGTMTKANLAEPEEEPEWRTPSFLVIVSAPPASQKGIITNTYYKLTEEQRQIEQPLMEQLNRYNANKKDSNKPQLPIRLMPERLSMTSLSTQLENAKGQHLLLFTPEIDTLKSSNGSGAWNDLSTVFRKAIDNDLLGQIYVSAESHCCNVPVCLNMLIESQPETLNEFLGKRNTLNGLDSRIIVVEPADTTGCRRLKVKKMSEFEWGNVRATIKQLQEYGHVVKEAEYDEEGNMVSPREVERQILNLPRSRRALERWGIGHQNNYLQTQDNAAEDHYFRRAKMLGFHAAMVAYMCSGGKETKAVTDFALWVAEFTLQSQLLHFGHTYNELYQNRMDKRLENIIRINQFSRFSLYNELPEEFTTSTMVELMQAHGRTLANPHNNIRRWQKNGMIVEVPSTSSTTKLWRKVKTAS